MAEWTNMEAVAEEIGMPLEHWPHQCHAVSIQIVRYLPVGAARVARGAARGVIGQHSWVVLGMDCMDMDAEIVDPTLFSYDETVEGIWTGTMRDDRHRPHGWTTTRLIEWGCPEGGDGDPIELNWPGGQPSSAARFWLNMFESHTNLDRQFWSRLVNHAPLKGWPVGEFIAAMDDTPDVTALVPIDILGMFTDRNPNGLYLRGDDADEG